MLATGSYASVSGMSAPPKVIPAPPVDWSCEALSPPTYWALRRLTWVLLVTESGDLPGGALSASGIPVLSLRIVVALSALVLPRRKLPPVAASANPAAPMISATVTATVAGPTDLSARPPRRRTPVTTCAMFCSLCRYF